MRVLIIDDEEDTRSIFNMSLSLLGGAKVMEARSGSEGIVKAAEEKPDVIILDLLMPDMDGTETFLALKSLEDTKQIPVIFMTVKGMFTDFEKMKSLGALAVIAKPFDPTSVTQSIKNILAANGYAHLSHSEANSEAHSEAEKSTQQNRQLPIRVATQKLRLRSPNKSSRPLTMGQRLLGKKIKKLVSAFRRERL